MLSQEGTDKDGYINRFYWSPDSSKLVVMRRKKGDERKVRIVESSPRKQLQPIVHEFRYLKTRGSNPAK